MRKMRGFSKTVAVVLCTAMLISGIVLPQGVVASDVTGMDKVYPDALLTESVFSEYFTGTATAAFSNNVMSVSGTAGKVLTSRTPIGVDDYTVSFDVKYDNDFHFRIKTNTGGDRFIGFRAYAADVYTVIASKTLSNQIAQVYATPKYESTYNGTDNWMNVTFAVEANKVTITIVYTAQDGSTVTKTQSVVYSDTLTSIEASYDITPDAYIADAENYIAFYREAGDYAIRNFQVYTMPTPVADVESAVYPANLLTSSILFGEHFTDNNACCSFDKEDGEGVMKFSSTGKTVISKEPIVSDSYRISFDARFDVADAHNGPFVFFKSNSTGTTNTIGIRWYAYSATGTRLAVKYGNSFAGQEWSPLYPARPTEWMHVDIDVTSTKATVSVQNIGGASYSYEILYSTLAEKTQDLDVSNLKNYIGFHAEGTSEFSIRKFQVYPTYDVSSETAPTRDEQLFSGFYSDVSLTSPYTEQMGYAYGKFVDANVLSVKAQKSDGTNGAKNVRFVTSVDSLNYGKVGFEITVGSKTITKETTKVYEALQAGTQQVDPSVFSSQSQYMAAYSLWEIPTSAFDTEIKVRAYWETPNGLIVYGAYRTVTVNSLA